MKVFSSRSTPFIGVVLVFIFGCSHSNTHNPNRIPQLFITPDTLRFTSLSLKDTIDISSNPSGELLWSITSKPGWISVNPVNGILNGSVQRVEITAMPGNLFPGIYRSVIEVTGDPNDSKSVVCYLTVLNYSEVHVDIDTLKLTLPEYSTSFILSNPGNSPLEWSANPSTDHLQISPDRGSIPQGDSAEILVNLDVSKMQSQSYAESISIISNSIFGTFTLPVAFEIHPFKNIQIVPPYVLFDFETDTSLFKVMNTGNLPAEWTSVGVPEYLAISPSSGVVAVGDSTIVQLVFDRSGLSTDTLLSTIEFLCYASSRDTLIVEAWNFLSDIWWLNFDIGDVEYNRNRDVMVTISPFNYSLNCINFQQRTVGNFELSRTAQCVSIHPDGSSAVVGHDGGVSFVDLTGVNEVKSFALSALADDIILGPNNWA